MRIRQQKRIQTLPSTSSKSAKIPCSWSDCSRRSSGAGCSAADQTVQPISLDGKTVEVVQIQQEMPNMPESITTAMTKGNDLRNLSRANPRKRRTDM